MMRIVLILFLSLLVCGNAKSQTYGINPNVTRLIDSAEVSFCEQDTLQTIAFLETIEKCYPNDLVIVMTNNALANLYLAKGQVAEAKVKLLYAFYYEPFKNDVFLLPGRCDKILQSSDIFRAKADLCLSISRLYLRQGQFDSSIYFLTLADTKYLPYNCANGMNMYRSFLSPYFADYYLTIGDTSKAIGRLLDDFMNPERNTILNTQKLKFILLQHWTPKEITAEVHRGFRQATFVKSMGEGCILQFTLFRHTMEKYCGRKRGFRAYYQKELSVKILEDTVN